MEHQGERVGVPGELTAANMIPCIVGLEVVEVAHDEHCGLISVVADIPGNVMQQVPDVGVADGGEDVQIHEDHLLHRAVEESHGMNTTSNDDRVLDACEPRTK